MALNVYCAGMAVQPTDEQWDNGTVFGVGSLMMVCGMSSLLSDKDVREMAVRVAVYERMTGTVVFRSKGTDGKLGDSVNSFGFWKFWQGVNTNVGRETRKQFLARIIEHLVSDEEYRLDREYTRQVKEAEVK